MMHYRQDLDEAVKVIDAIFHEIAERSVQLDMDVSVDAAVHGAWRLFERGMIHLVEREEAESIGLAETRTATERFRLQRKHRRLVERWRAMRREAVTHG